MLFSNPFRCDPKSAPANMQLELIELQESSDLKSSFRDLPLDKFYSLVPASTYSVLHKHASRMASLFGSTYICEKTFSVINRNIGQHLLMNIFNQSFKFLQHNTHQDTKNLLAKSHSYILHTRCADIFANNLI